MKLILSLVFVFSFGILTLLAEKITQHQQRVGPASNDPSVTYRDALMKREVSRRSSCRSGMWHKVNSSPVCFEAKNNQFGRFYAPSSGKLAAIKLVHRYGYVSCHTGSTSHWSYWGCGADPCLRGQVNVVITTSANHVLLPSGQFITTGTKWSKIPGHNSLSPELVLSVFSQPHGVTAGQELRLWYGEDLVNQSEEDNGGRACCDVYAHYA